MSTLSHEHCQHARGLPCQHELDVARCPAQSSGVKISDECFMCSNDDSSLSVRGLDALLSRRSEHGSHLLLG